MDGVRYRSSRERDSRDSGSSSSKRLLSSGSRRRSPPPALAPGARLIDDIVHDRVELGSNPGSYAAIVKKRKGAPPHMCPVCDFSIAVFSRLAPCLHIACASCSKKLMNFGLVHSVAKSAQNPCPVYHQPVKSTKQIDYAPAAPVHICGHCQRAYMSEFAMLEHVRIRHSAKNKGKKKRK